MSFQSGSDNFGGNGLRRALAISLLLHIWLLWQKSPTATDPAIQAGPPRPAVLLNASLHKRTALSAAAATSATEVSERPSPLSVRKVPPAALQPPRAVPQNQPEGAAATGEGLDAAGLRQYRLSLAAAARDYKVYPVQALQNGWRGTAEVSLAVAANGVSQPVQLLRSSGHVMLDAAAMEMIGQAARRTVLPASLRGQSFSVPLPVVFDVDGQ